MKRVLLSLFSERSTAVAARRWLDLRGPADCRTRLHAGEIEPQLGIELDGTRAQSADERSVGGRFGLVFLAFAALGLALDLIGLGGDVGLPLTMTLGSLGVFAGTVAVLVAQLQPLDAALAEIGDEMKRGAVLLAVTVRDADDERTASDLQRLGGRTVFEA